uniref:Uncharacterized protein n=1 Tax=uncultured marine group II/III euryarchaeote KM3_82_C12 TaxID=1456518 RepID=A0A075HPF0_9EURY|nr:hypothetical protein [uncultured marine group II/III euryarchaeote KM3_82_C12]
MERVWSNVIESAAIIPEDNTIIPPKKTIPEITPTNRVQSSKVPRKNLLCPVRRWRIRSSSLSRGSSSTSSPAASATSAAVTVQPRERGLIALSPIGDRGYGLSVCSVTAGRESCTE